MSVVKLVSISAFKDMIGPADLEGLEFVSIRRLKVELQHELFDRVAGVIGNAARQAGTLEKIKDLARFPRLLAEALSSHPFDRIRVFIYPFCSTQTNHIEYLGGCALARASLASSRIRRSRGMRRWATHGCNMPSQRLSRSVWRAAALCGCDRADPWLPRHAKAQGVHPQVCKMGRVL